MRLGVLVALALMLATPPAAADDPVADAETVELDYRVPAGCPDQRAFVTAVTARTRRARIVSRAADARRFTVEVHRTNPAAGYKGRLVIEHGAERAIREVASVRCEDLVEALVFFTAIAIDPAASLGPPEPSLPLPSSEPAAAPPVDPPPQQPEHARSTPSPSPSPAPPPPPAVMHLALGSGAWTATGIAETMMVAAHPVIDFSSSATGLSPSLRLGLVWANSASQPAPLGRLTLGVRAIVLSSCAYHLDVGGRSGVAVRLCAMFEGGVLAIRPFALERPSSPDRPWLALGPLVRAELPVLAQLLLGAEAGVAFPLEREHVFLLGGPTAELVRAVGLRLGATVTMRLF